MNADFLPKVFPFAVAAIGMHAAIAASPATINGGGATSQQFNYAAPDANGKHVAEMPLFDSLQSSAAFGTYWSTISSAAQTALLNNDLSCVMNKATGANGGNCNNTVGGTNTVHYAVAESVLTSTQLANWASSSTGQSAAGDLIQIPMLGTGLAVVVNNPSLTGNGQAQLSDADLCGVFSGKITNFNQITDTPRQLPSGTIALLYRSDSAGTTFLLTNHLSAVCTPSTSNVTFVATSTLASLFPGGTVPQNFVGVAGLSNLADTLAGLTGTTYANAISYISPDWTSVDSATSTAKLSNGQPSPLFVAGLQNGPTYYLPTVNTIKLGLTHPGQGQHLTPPTTAAEAVDPSSWVPLIQTTKDGYPMVGYSTLDLPQCYADPAIMTGVIAFLTDHFHNTAFRMIENNNGLVAVANSGGAKFVAAITDGLISNKRHWNANINNPATCAGLAGR